jgi:hydrogenase maturation protein HypF
VRLPRDLALCEDCRRDITNALDRRNGYPFTNCTACGPRYSIIEAMPFDRPATAMRIFPMCALCTSEYHAPADRRFHAQANACAQCGPRVALWDVAGQALADTESAIRQAAALLRQGRILALKVLGGFQLLVRADQKDAVLRLRQRKHRPSKPLAVMIPSLELAERIAQVGPAERRVLTSSANPIVLLQKRSEAELRLLPDTQKPAESVAPSTATIGLFLPTTPLHRLLLQELGLPVVATSGNRSDEPIVTEERQALQTLGDIAHAFLVHDRPIVRRVDDSVVRVMGGQETVFRLGRGYAPLPLPALEALAARQARKPLPGCLATGGQQKTAPALWTGTQAVLAQHVGDLDHPDSRAAFSDVARDLENLFQCKPLALACDLHPDYFTTRWALSQHKPVIPVQHHHAHALACMTEHGLLDTEVLALSWDGTGYGPDGTIWGGEALLVRANKYQRLASLLPFPLPGGEAAIRRPNRIAFALLWLLQGDEVLRDDLWLRRLGLSKDQARILATMTRSRIHTPWTSSVGRLFDAVAALVLGVHEVSYEGEAAVRLEAVADPDETGEYPLPLCLPGQYQSVAGDDTLARGDWRPMLSAILRDMSRDVGVGVIAGRFHNSLARWAVSLAGTRPGPVVLSGGCFQNRLLVERTREGLAGLGRQVFCQGQVPPGDGGLAVGQLAAALAASEA